MLPEIINKAGHRRCQTGPTIDMEPPTRLEHHHRNDILLRVPHLDVIAVAAMSTITMYHLLPRALLPGHTLIE